MCTSISDIQEKRVLKQKEDVEGVYIFICVKWRERKLKQRKSGCLPLLGRIVQPQHSNDHSLFPKPIIARDT